MSGIDVSEWQAPGSVNFAAAGIDFVIIRASHGTTEDRHWREHFNAVVAAGKPLGLYHYMELGVPENEASFFHGLVGFLTAEQVAMGWWLDVEEGQSAQAVDRFRSWVALSTIGVYANLSSFATTLATYQRFQLNWLAWPDYPANPSGYPVPNHILRQGAPAFGVDWDTKLPAQPFPDAWSS